MEETGEALKKDVSAEKARELLISKHFLEKDVRRFLKERGGKGESYESLSALLRGTPFKKIFKEKWEHETSTQWGERTVDEALTEATIHAFSILSVYAQLFLLGSKGYQDKFPGLSREEVERIPRQTELLAGFFNESFRKKNPSLI